MRRELFFWRLALALTLAALAGALASCGAEALAGTPRVWIDVPRDGTEISADGPVDVISHAYAREGVAETMLSVDGEPYTRGSPSEPGASFTQITHQWFPPGPGDYVLQVRAYDTEGEMSNAAIARVTVAGEPTLGVTVTPVDTATPTATGVPAATPSATAVPPTAVPPTPVPPTAVPPTAVPPPPTIVSYQADPSTVDYRGCTRLSWAVEGIIAEVWVDGEGVRDHGSTDRCGLENPTTFTLKAVGPGGETTAHVRVEVRQPPADTEGPSISQVQQSTNDVCSGGCCGPVPTSINISARVTDDTGVGSVELYCTVVDRSTGSTVQSERYCDAFVRQGSTWAVTYTPPSNLSNHRIIYRIRAADNSTAQNVSWSGTGSFLVGHRIC